MKRKLITGFSSLCGLLLISSCQQEENYPEQAETAQTAALTRDVTIPEDAIEIPDTTTVLNLAGGSKYVIRDSVTITGITGSTSTNNTAELYIPGTLTINAEKIDIPDGVLITITDGGSCISSAEVIGLGESTSFYVTRQGKLLFGSTGMYYRNNTTEGAIINYGYIELYQLLMKRHSFLNMTGAVAYICNFSKPTETGGYVNLGTIFNCEGGTYE